MGDAAGGSYTVATDIADALIARGATARAAHALVGSAIACAERDGRPIDATDLAQLADDAGIDELLAPLDARDSIDAKRTIGSTSLAEVRAHIAGLRANLATHAGTTA
jgi:argininosuccinate lyase